ncbi:uncharacterized protein LOC101858116 isoform X2 [Aplysia californica]|nr:uncharacterized protein LOC101858116 isoform X2 [Aplysia californica]XP_005102416.1 uncharacterized protein LOC101858116 isoform X2 [Aplysia californica]
MENLPDEVLLCIFSKLPQPSLIISVRRTCWRWYRLSHDASLWLDLDLSVFKCGYNPHKTSEGVKCLLETIQQSLTRLMFGDLALEEDVFELFGSAIRHKNKVSFPNLKSLDYSYSSVNSRSLSVGLTANSDIEELILSFTDIPFCQAMKEAIHLPNLKKLIFHDFRSVEWEFALSRHVDRAPLKAALMMVPKHCPLLEVVEIDTVWCHLDNDVVQEFTKHCLNLKRAGFTWSSQITENAFQYLKTDSHQITELVLSDRQARGPYLSFVLPYFPLLLELTVSGHNVSMEDCKAIGDCCPLLKELTFERSSVHNEGQIFDMLERDNSLCGSELNLITDKCHDLRKLHAPCSNIDDISVMHLSKQCPYLEDVNFTQCRRLTSKSVRSLSNYSLCLKKVNFIEVDVECNELLGLFKKCSKLEEAVFDFNLRTLSKSKSRTPSPSSSDELSIDLTALEDQAADLFPDETVSCEEDIPLMDVMQCSEDVDYFDLLDGLKTQQRPKLSDATTGTLFDYSIVSSLPCPIPVKAFHCHLRKLSLKNCTCSSKSLQALFRECPDLTLVALDDSTGLDDETVITLVRFCPSLRTLSLSSTPKASHPVFGDLALLEMAKYSTQLEVVNLLYNKSITTVGLTALFLSLDTTLRSLHSLSLCVGRGYHCSVQTVVAHGLKHLTERSKQNFKSAAEGRGRRSFLLLHLEFLRQR